MTTFRRVFAFGTFDGVHRGHRVYLRQAKAAGDHLTVVVARDCNVIRAKGRPPRYSERERLALIQDCGESIDRVILGTPGDPLDIFKHEPIDVVILGYDQVLSEAAVQKAAAMSGQQLVVERARSFVPGLFSNRLLYRLGRLGRWLRAL
ncbi:adenylyltransferase/cytidyltransferase family protein [Candidatus Berkelbacteria bacterium]|nr:adenylyltransferase/cytidyltransferase family protein [Candidatus Berkelbacteria bacterium]